MDQWVLDYQTDINSAIDQFFAGHYTGTPGHNETVLRDAVMYAVKNGEHSRIYTILAMVAYEEFLGITADTVIHILCGIEFIHAGLALHSDATGIHNIYATDDASTIKKYGEGLSIVIGDILMELGIDRLSQSGSVKLIQEALSSTGDTGYLRGVARDILTDHTLISEKEYLVMYDEKIARGIVASFLIGSLLAGDNNNLLKDQFRQFGTFLARIYQVGYDIDLHEKALANPNSEVNRERGVVDFVGYEKAKTLYEELYIELMRMAGGFQNSKFQDIITLFKDRTINDI